MNKTEGEANVARVLLPLAQGCEELEAVTIIDLLRRGGIEVVTAGLDDQPVRASRGVVLIPDTTLDRALEQEFDMIALPGGLGGTDRLNADSRVRDLLIAMAESGKFTAAICAAPRVLADTGLLKGKAATGYPGVLEAMDMSDIRIRRDTVVTDGKIITSRGPGTAMDFALSLIEHLAGSKTRQSVEAGLQRG